MGTEATAMVSLTANQYDLVHGSLGLASMAASTVFFFLRLGSFHERYQAALCFTGLVTFIAMYHYFRIFDPFVAAYTPCEVTDGAVNYNKCDPEKYGYSPTGIPFNDAYRYVDWFLTVPLLLIEIVLVMRLSEEETFQRCTTLGVGSALMILNAYPVVYIIPMLSGSESGKAGLTAGSMVGIPVGYTASDIISKCGVGYLVYRIGLAKSMAEDGKYEAVCVDET